MSKVRQLQPRAKPPLDTPTDLSPEAVKDISAALNAILADSLRSISRPRIFTGMSAGPHFRDYHLLLDEQAEQIFSTTDEIAERVRRIGGITLKSIGQIAGLQRINDNEDEFVPPLDMLRELMDDNKAVVEHIRQAHKIADDHEDVATASQLELYIDAAEKRVWFLFEASRAADRSGH